LAKLANNQFKRVQGILKLEKKIRQELKFLQKFEDPEHFSELKKEHISCSNLIHLSCIVDQMFLVADVCSVLQPFNLKLENKSKKVLVDIVCDKGHTWIKVVARNPLALNQNSQGGSQFGQRNIMDQVVELKKCSSENLILFEPPRVKIVFASGITNRLRRRVMKIGAAAEGTLVDDETLDDDIDSETDEDSSSSDSEEVEDDTEDVNDFGVDDTKLNLDITAMIAYVSAMTNGRNWFKFQEKILTEQSEWERQRPVKPVLDKMFTGKQLVCCQSAMNDFKQILGTLGGPGERLRGEELISRILVIPDQQSPKTENLMTSGKIKSRSQVIFATGDNLRIVTVTANTGFLRAAAGQGVTFATLTHESRALTEDKEKNAVDMRTSDTSCGAFN